MSSVDLEQRVAILLNALGKEMADDVLSRLSTQGELRLRNRLQSISENPPDEDDITEIIGEFDRILQFAVVAVDDELNTDVSVDDAPAADEVPNDDALDEEPDETSFSLSDDAVADLQKLKPYQIAGGLLGEAPRTMAIVLDCLEPERASQALKYFPDATQSDVFSQLNSLPRTSPALLTRIARSTLERGLRVKQDALESTDVSKEKKLADMLRVMEKKDRTKILEQLEQEDEALVAKIRELLYEFDDVRKIEDRSLQKLLGEIESKTLCTALSGAEEAVISKVTGNLSKRARESLLEEMSLMGNVREEDQDAARADFTAAMQRLDQAGELVML